MENQATLTQELIPASEYSEEGPDEDEAQRLDGYHEIMVQMTPQLPARGIPHIKGLNRKRVMQAFQDSFELIGGVPRLALWADEHPGEFYRMYTKLLPSQSVNMIQNNQTIIKHVIPPTALDD